MTAYNIPLKDAADPLITVNLPGVYILKKNGRIMKVGSAKIGIQKRMQQYYGLNKYCGLNQFINEMNRDSIYATYQTCNYDECEELESKLFRKYGTAVQMPWATRQPHKTTDFALLLI